MGKSDVCVCSHTREAALLRIDLCRVSLLGVEYLTFSIVGEVNNLE